jgi:2-polyprenyl-3-methyl-5-hydroxy-6-metoxy-1,4-benzoquinol methylase
MKNSFILAKTLPGQFARLLETDQREIDNPDPYKPACRNYLDRIETVVGLVKKMAPPNAEVAEIGSAQGNMSLLLAEQGFQARAIDINPMFLDYSKLKYERGSITWLHSNLEDLNPSLLFDAVILGEIIEHCAWPEKVIIGAVNHLKPEGLLIVTTPNAEKINEHLPTFSSFADEAKRRELEKLQFGPDGENHLFLFTLKEMKSLVPAGTKLVDWGYLGGSLALNSRTHHLFRFLPLKLYGHMIRWMSRIPILNRFSFHNIYMVIQKPS